MTRHIPNLLTCCNLILGVFALILIVQGDYLGSIYCVVGAALFDVFDGAAARWLKVSSPIGKDLDSLADMVSFGVVPALWATSLLAGLDHTVLTTAGFHWVGMIIAPASALRLAKFNNDTRQTVGFIGMPTPANTMLWAGLLVLALDTPFGIDFYGLGPVLSRVIWEFLVLTTAAMLHAPVPMLSLKVKRGGISANKWQVILVLSAIGLVSWLQISALAPLMALYIVFSLIANQAKQQA